MNKKKQNKTISGESIDTPQMRSMRELVVEQELTARSWKAYYEKMYYALESEKLEELYKQYQERVDEKLKKQRAETMEKMKSEGFDPSTFEVTSEQVQQSEEYVLDEQSKDSSEGGI